MTTLILEGYLVKEKTDEGKMFYFTDMPEGYRDGEFSCGKEGDLCFDFEAPIREFINVGDPTKCKITIKLEK